MTAARSAWVRLGKSGVTAATRALLVWWLPFLIIPGSIFCVTTLPLWGVYSRDIGGWLLALVVVPTLLGFGWNTWRFRALYIQPVQGKFRRGWGLEVAASQLTFALTLAKNPKHPVIVLGNNHWRARISTADAQTGVLSPRDYQLLIQTLQTAYFVQDYTARSLVGDGIRIPKAVRTREELVSDFLGLERLSYDSAGLIRLLNLLQREAAGPDAESRIPGKHRKRLAVLKEIPNMTAQERRQWTGRRDAKAKSPKPLRLDSLRFLLGEKNLTEQKNLIIWLRGNGNFLYLGRSTVQTLLGVLAFLVVVGFPFYTYWFYSLAYDARMFWLEDVLVGVTIVGTLLMAFLVHPALMLIRYGLVKRYQNIHAAVAAELHQRAIDEEMNAGSHDPDEPEEATLKRALPNDFGSLEYFLKPQEHLREKVALESSETRMAAPARETVRSARPDFADRPALIREVMDIIDREAPLVAWRDKFTGSMGLFSVVWIIYLIVFWILGFMGIGADYYDSWRTLFLPGAIVLTALSVTVASAMMPMLFNVLRWEWVIRQESNWLLKKMRQAAVS